MTTVEIYQPSLKKRLLLGLLIPNVVFWILTSIGSMYIGKYLTKDAYDDSLEDSLRTIVARFRPDRDSAKLDLSSDALHILEDDPDDKWYFSIYDADKVVITQNHSLPLHLSGEHNSEFFDESVDGEPVRGIVRKISLKLRNGVQKDFFVEAAETTHAREDTIAQIIRLSSALAALLVIICFLATWLATKFVLKPLDHVQRIVRERAPGHLADLSPSGMYKEVIPLVEALNDLLSRLRKELDDQKQVLSDVAHMVRTRLAGIKVHSELGAREECSTSAAHTFHEIKEKVSDLAREVVNLLSHVRSERNLREIEALVPLTLHQVCSDVVKDFKGQAVSRQMKLDLLSETKNIFVLGNQKGLRILIENLVDNSIRYTPEGGLIRVKLIARDTLHLTIEDSGPGIPYEEREKVFSPFYRVSATTSEGSGLGLAIVQRIAERHRAKISIDSSEFGGACVRIIFPIQKTEQEAI
jgi:two-component system sensor histidine kinase TctE